VWCRHLWKSKKTSAWSKSYACSGIKARRESRGITPLILNLGPTWRRVVKFTTWPLYTRKGTSLPIEHEAAWAPESVRMFWWRGKIACFLPGFEFATVQHLRVVTILTALLRSFEKLDSLFKTSVSHRWRIVW